MPSQRQITLALLLQGMSMPTRLDTNFLPPKNPEEFESMVRDICAMEWRDPHTAKFGRRGQKQFGVDIYGKPPELDTKYHAAQCKLRTQGDRLSRKEIEAEVREARSFPHELGLLIIATDTTRDTDTQVLVNEICEHEVAHSGLRVTIWFWDDITERLATYPRLIVRYYHDFYANLTTLPVVERLVDTPLQVILMDSSSALSVQQWETLVALRGIRPLNLNSLAWNQMVGNLDEVLPDGIVCAYPTPAVLTMDEAIAFRLMNHIRLCEYKVERDCPIIVILLPEQIEDFFAQYQSLGGDEQRITAISSILPQTQIADAIFNRVFDYGYSRRGSLTTVDVTARGDSRRPSSTFLDMDWHNHLTPDILPSNEQWERLLLPALRGTTQKLISIGDRTRLQVASGFLLPAAVALGFYLNIRVARVGVWTRRVGTSDLKQQFWLSDHSSQDMPCAEHWIKQPDGSGTVAVVEMGSFKIHVAVETFVAQAGIPVTAWLQVQIDETIRNIEEAYALGCANQLARAVRGLTAQGITDIHLFLRTPSALAVLIGQRLQACGRIHLYWYANPTYQYAFTLK
jgi:hypothetical protein